MTAPTPWEACGCVIRDADSIEVCTVALWCKKPSEVAARIVRAVNCHAYLLESLEVAVEWIINDCCWKRCNKPGCDDPNEQCAEYLGNLKATIAKVRGEQ